ncbi:MAG: hypothetical protein NC124_04700 [Clostridium sp.]|nr:hypothetical protein [Clostridium sp.]
MMKKKRRNSRNQGNSFVMVVATISFLAILVAAILVAVALCYRLKAYDINARDNFYYLEQAMDEIYAGVGGDAMKHLNEAYDDTLEVMVYYDTSTRSYVTMDNEQANKILKNTFMDLVQKDDDYSTQANIENHLIGFLSYAYDDGSESGKEGVQLTVEKIVKTQDDLSICNLILKREAQYSTVNARSKKDSDDYGTTVASADTFIQTMTTDLVIGKPEFDVSFNTISSDLSDLYGFSMIADMGVEITGEDGKTALGNKVNVTGNVYAASDFYNKTYNEDPGNTVTVGGAATTVTSDQIQKVNSYDANRLKDMDGVNANSMYSGFYVDGATVVMASDRIIVPGSIAAINCADITISSIANSSVDYADVWADGIVLDGYSLKQNIDGSKLKGASINMKAKAYIYDDLEVNANSSNVLLNGQYFGYNYASTDNRTFTDASIKNGMRKFTKDTDDGITDGQGVKGQSHYNSSAIILNGENTTLDFSLTNALYVAGQAYIEVSKTTKESENAETVSYTVQNGAVTQAMTDEVKSETDSYPTTQTKDGEIEDNYTIDNDSQTPGKTPIQDYRTGEAISVKSNQLVYIPNWTVHDKEDGLWLSLPSHLRQLDVYKGIWSDFNKIPVIKTVISGKKYYFLDFSKADIKDKNVMNQFIADYAALFDESTATGEDGTTKGESYGLIDITDYEYFQVEMLKVSSDTAADAYANIYTNSAITSKVGDTFTIVANSNNIEPLRKAASNINEAIEEGNDVQAAIDTTTSDSAVLASRVSEKLQMQYKEMKWLLSNTSRSGEFVTEAHNLAEEVITPINHYFNFELLDSHSQYCALQSGYGVWVSDGDVKIGAASCKIGDKSENSYSTPFRNGKVRGIVLAKGDVTFSTDVEEFEGLIVTGGKIIVNNFDKVNGKTSMSFLANEEIIKSILRECDNSRGESATKNFGFVCDIFRLFESQYVPPVGSDETATVSMKSVSAVQFEDILSLRNWKKNVD